MNNQPRDYTTITQSVHALQWDGLASGREALHEFLGLCLISIHDRGTVAIHAGAITQRGEIGDWVVKHANGTFAIVPAAVFDELYVLADGPAAAAAAEPDVPRETDTIRVEDVGEIDVADLVDPTLADA